MSSVSSIRAADTPAGPGWSGPAEQIAFDQVGCRAALLELGRPCYAIRSGGRVGLTTVGQAANGLPGHHELLATLARCGPRRLAAPSFARRRASAMRITPARWPTGSPRPSW